MYAFVGACGIRQKVSWYGSHLPIRVRLIYAARLGHGTMTLEEWRWIDQRRVVEYSVGIKRTEKGANVCHLT